MFYFGQNPDRIDLLDALLSSAGSHSGKNLMSSAATIGLALQACYLSPVKSKLEVWKWVVDAFSISMDEYGHAVEPDPQYPVLSFLNSYLYGRDSAALSHLKPNSEELLTWAKEKKLSTSPVDSDRRIFRLITGLIESGDIEPVEALLRKFRPADVKLLLGIHLGAYLTQKVRPVSTGERRIAKSIVEHLNEPIAGMRAQLAQEFESLLLEMRDGKPIALEQEQGADESDA